uniref:Uncharacterized protein n=1 Tax=Osugoroshi virus TaxID=2202814 RepID=A0A7R7T248_9VIRU|nr:hypothetical protein [Osugoroshi virus]
MVHIPKDVPVFLDFLPTSLEDCVKLIKIYGQWLFTAESQEKYQLASDFENILDHLRYRYIKIQKLTDPESSFIVHLYEQLMPVEFHYSVGENKNIAKSDIVADQQAAEPVEISSQTEELPPVVDLIVAEKLRILDQAVTNKPIEVEDLTTVLLLDAMTKQTTPQEIPDAVNTDVNDVVEIKNTPPDSVEMIDDSPTSVLIQPKVLGTLKELQLGLDPVIEISGRRRPIKKHVRQMINNVNHGAIILSDPDGNVAARELLRANSGCAVVQQKDYICVSRDTKVAFKVSPEMKEFVLSIMAEANDYDKQ